MADLSDLTADELLAGYRGGEFSPSEATRDVLAAVDQKDADINAFVLVDGERARQDAAASTERWRTGAVRGPGDGVPTSIKDIFYTRSWPTLRGTRLISEEGPWNVDAPVVARLRETGAVLVGKTTTPEFAWKGRHRLPPARPDDPGLTPVAPAGQCSSGRRGDGAMVGRH